MTYLPSCGGQFCPQHRYAETHFKGRNLYIETIERNIRFAIEVGKQGDLSLLRRLPPPPGSTDTDPA